MTIPKELVLREGTSFESPVAIFIHGRGGNRQVMSPFIRAIPPEWTIVALEAPLSDPIGGYSWWLMHEDGTAQTSIREGINQAELQIKSSGLLDGKRPLIGVGFSQGAATTAALALKGAIPFQAVVLLAGFVLPEPSPSGTSFDFLMVHGTLDTTIPLLRAREGADYLRSLGHKGELFEEEVAHKLGIQGMRKFREFLSSLDFS